MLKLETRVHALVVNVKLPAEVALYVGCVSQVTVSAQDCVTG